MIDRLNDDDELDDETETSDDSDDVDLDDGTDNIGDPSVEINVEELIVELEAHGLTSQLDKDVSTRRRLEELMERKRARRELEDFDDYDI